MLAPDAMWLDELAEQQIATAERATAGPLLCRSTTVELPTPDAGPCATPAAWIVSCRTCQATTYLCDHHSDAVAALFPLMCQMCGASGRGFGLLRFTSIDGNL